MDLAGISNLPIQEKLQLVERLWDEIGASDEPIPLPAWAMEEARRRLDEMKADPSAQITEDEVWRRVESRRG